MSSALRMFTVAVRPLKSSPRRAIPGRLLPMRPMPRLAALLLGFVLLCTSAEAQRPTRRILSRPWPTAPAAQPSDVRAAEAPVVAEPTEDTPRTGPARRTAPVAAPEPPVEVAVPAAAPALSVFGRTGLRVTLPDGWSEPAAVDESRLPAYALYAFRATSGPLAGATLRVEQVVGLNPAEEQQWRTGRTARGYDGVRPVGPATVGGALVAFETAGTGAAGATAFFQRGRTFWAIQVQAPGAVWSARRADVMALFSGVELPAPATP